MSAATPDRPGPSAPAGVGEATPGPARRILYICNDGYYFGQHRQHLALRAAQAGLDAHVAVGGEPAPADGALTFHRLTVQRLGFSPRADLALASQIRRLVRRLRPDIIHIITMKPAVIAAAALAVPLPPPIPQPRRIVVTFPGLGRIFEDRSLAGRTRRRLVEMALRRFLRRGETRATFENANDLAHFVDKRIIAADRAMLTAGAGLDLERFASRRERGRQPFRVLWASRLIRGKGLAPFLEAASLARAAGAAVEFQVAGYADPGHADRLPQAEIDALGRNPAIRFLGHVTDMPKLLGEVDALALPSRYQEGLPRILIEGAAAGLALIASDVPGCRAVVHDGVTGLLLEGLTGADIWSAVRRLVESPAEARRLGDAAHDFVRREGFDQRAVQDAFLEAYGMAKPPRRELTGSASRVAPPMPGHRR